MLYFENGNPTEQIDHSDIFFQIVYDKKMFTFLHNSLVKKH